MGSLLVPNVVHSQRAQIGLFVVGARAKVDVGKADLTAGQEFSFYR
jgi:hypothetical protein